jgi:Cof subfamily protein (haloacid dehalogenase superfamily)
VVDAGSPVRLIGIDVDGTLVGSSGNVESRVWHAAQRALSAGIRLALCSGRPAFGVALDYARRLDDSGWHVFQNGASILNLASGESQAATLPLECVAQLIAQARRCDRILELYSDRRYVVEHTGAWARAHAGILGVPFEPGTLESLREPIVRAQWLLSAQEATDALSAAHSGVEISESMSPLMPDTRFVGLTRAGVSKGSALRTIAAAYGIPLADVMYVGDAGNDLPALEIVGHPVAMGNASPAVMKAATRVVADVDHAGLAEALDRAIASGTA